MLNQFSTAILERMLGRKIAVILGDISGISERAWRDRIKRGWEPKEKERCALNLRITAALTDRMIRLGEWSADEAAEILGNTPSTKANAFLPTADLIYCFSPHQGVDCQETIAMATSFDQYCEQLGAALHARNLDSARTILVDRLAWLESYCPPDTETEDVAHLLGQFDASTDLETLLDVAKPLHDALLLHVLSCWDVEFCAGYFGGGMQAHPLFQLVMPRFAPDITLEPDTGRLLRNGRQPRTRIFETATARLIDFIAVLTAWKRNGRLPATIPRVKDFSAWSDQDEQRVVSWRDETTRFTVYQLEKMWLKAMKPDKLGIYPGVPLPLYVCAHLFSPFLQRENNRVTGIIDCADNYLTWWKRNRDRMVAKGLQFGSQAWPDYLASQRPGEGLSSMALSCQSSGRSSSPRDCQ